MKFLAMLLSGTRILVQMLLLYLGIFAILWFTEPWRPAEPDAWNRLDRIVVTDTSGKTVPLPYSDYLTARKGGQAPLARPSEPSGSMAISVPGRATQDHVTWQTASSDLPWRFQVDYDARDYVRQVRYRLEGERLILVERRSRGQETGFTTLVYSLVALVVWKMVAAYVRRREPLDKKDPE